MFDEAQKLGLNMDDLEEYGFDKSAMRCGNAGCRKMNETFEEYVHENTEIVKKISNIAIEKCLGNAWYIVMR